ncbi:S8 family serine peptidase [Saccharopolyspora sp. K220]|nr:S8 family serine peptidase [Saccharopolyspora soli]
MELSHPCFAGADLTRLDTLVQESAGRGPMSLHGTHVTSLLFGQVASPVVGLVPRCRGLILPIFSDGGEGRVPQLDLARAIEQAVQAGANVINISGGERSPDGKADGMLERALRLCADNGVLIVSAVGNDGCDCLQVPAAAPSVLAVGAVGPEGQPLEINNWGEAYRTNGVLAPGQDIEGAAPGGGRASLTGSSFATPLVSGVAALLLAVQRHNGRTPDARGVRAAILETASRCYPDEAPECRRHLAGTLNFARAFELIATGGSTAVTNSDEAQIVSHAVQPNAQHGETGAEASGEARTFDASHCQSNDAEPVSPGRPDEGVSAAGEPCAAQTPSESEGGSIDTGRTRGTAEVASCSVEPRSLPAGSSSESAVGPSSGCGCQGNSMRPLVYAIGSIGFDFQTESRRDGFRQQMDRVEVRTPDSDVFTTAPANPYDPRQLNAYLARNPWASDKLTWTLELDRTPIYALEAETPVGMDWGEPILDPSWDMERTEQAAGRPAELAQLLTRLSSNPPVSVVHRIFRDAIVGQVLPPDNADFVSRVSIPGVLTGRTTRLFSGQVLPVVEVKSRGVHTWNEAALVEAAVNTVKSDANNRGVTVEDEVLRKNTRGFLDKIYYQFRNLGQSPGDRALNYAATNAFMFTNEINEGLLSGKYVPGANENFYTLDSISVSKSPYCRPGSECQDVVLTFFDPENERRAKVSYLFTIDVSESPPVSLAPAHRFIGGV